MTNTILWTIVILTVLGLLLSLILFWVAKKFKVEEDPRIDEVEKVMPGANCGGCGFAGCRAFADAAVKAPDLDNNYCPVGGNETMKKVAAVLGQPLKMPATDYTCSAYTDDRLDIRVEAQDLCPRYLGHYVRNITTGTMSMERGCSISGTLTMKGTRR